MILKRPAIFDRFGGEDEDYKDEKAREQSAGLEVPSAASPVNVFPDEDLEAVSPQVYSVSGAEESPSQQYTVPEALQPPNSFYSVPEAVEPPNSFYSVPEAVEPPNSFYSVPGAVNPPSSFLTVPPASQPAPDTPEDLLTVVSMLQGQGSSLSSALLQRPSIIASQDSQVSPQLLPASISLPSSLSSSSVSDSSSSSLASFDRNSALLTALGLSLIPTLAISIPFLAPAFRRGRHLQRKASLTQLPDIWDSIQE